MSFRWHRDECLHRIAGQSIDRMETIGVCWKAVSDLVNPESDLHTVDREELATLLDFLAREYELAQANFRDAIQDDDND